VDNDSKGASPFGSAIDAREVCVSLSAAGKE
jgi:hypothetical protein